MRGGDQGDLYIVVHVKEHPIFQREDDNLFCEVPISFATAALGAEVPVPTLEGKASLKVPAGTQSGQSFKLRGKGVVHVNGRERGDLYARLLVEVPSRPECRATPEAGRIRRALRRRKHSAAQKLLRSREGNSFVRPDAMGEFALGEVLREIIAQEQEHLQDLADALGIDTPKIEG